MNYTIRALDRKQTPTVIYRCQAVEPWFRRWTGSDGITPIIQARQSRMGMEIKRRFVSFGQMTRNGNNESEFKA